MPAPIHLKCFIAFSVVIVVDHRPSDALLAMTGAVQQAWKESGKDSQESPSVSAQTGATLSGGSAHMESVGAPADTQVCLLFHSYDGLTPPVRC